MPAVHLTDVTLRDGLQMVPQVLSVDQKIALLGALEQCGYDRIEITSFVNPAKMPQFADAEKLCEKLYAGGKGGEWMAFVPNERGTDRLFAFPIPWVACFVSVSAAFNQKNVNATIDESLAQVEAIVKRVKRAKRKVRVYISTVFGCPYQGAIDPQDLKKVFKRVASLKPHEISLGDTIGVATPDQVQSVLKGLGKLYPLKNVALHLHNTYGLGVAAAQAGFDAGIRRFDGATGGVGGCPYAKGASGNVATEDLLYAFYRQGAAKAFAREGIQNVLKMLSQDLKIAPQGRLSEVWKQGGAWYGV